MWAVPHASDRDRVLLPLPAGAILFSPWVDMEVTGESYDDNRDAFFTRDLVRELAAGYGLGMLDATETGVSRILAFGGGAPLAARFGLPAVMRS